MAIDRFLIAPLNSGLQNNLKPWLISDSAYSQLQNAYLWRGRVRKRFGSTYMSDGTDVPSQYTSRLRAQIGSVSLSGGVGVFSGSIPAGSTAAIGQAFSVGNSILYTVYQLAGGPLPMYVSTGTSTGTYTSGGAVVLGNIDPALNNQPVYFYPGLPVMGLEEFNTQIVNEEFTIGFDTTYAYQYFSTGWNRLSTENTMMGESVWHGTDTNFFWSCNYQGVVNGKNIFFTTNNYVSVANVPDLIRYFDGTTWFFLEPQWGNNGNQLVVAALIVVPFQNRLLLFNVTEQDGAPPFLVYPNRMRYSAALFDPTIATNWNSVTPGKGGFEDCPLTEAVVTVEFIKNRLIVFMENSTWEIAYTGNKAQPFIWQQLNTEFGSESTFSPVPFDRDIFVIGNVGIMSCNGSNVSRIDDLIPQDVFTISDNNNGVLRVAGIRDYFAELVYWTLPSEADTSSPYPNRVLVYNYKTQSWAYNDDSITTFGYWQNLNGVTWQESVSEWRETEDLWVDGEFEATFRQVIGGNQQGYTFVIDINETVNAAVLQLTKADFPTQRLTIINHNLEGGDYIAFYGATSIGFADETIVLVTMVIDANTITIDTPFTAGYVGGATIARVSEISIMSKQYNFYVEKGRNAYISRIDFMVDRTQAASIQLDVFASSSNYSLVAAGQASGALVGTCVLDTFPYDLYPLEQQQDRLWHPVYVQAEGECVQFQLYMNDAQMRNPGTSLADFQMGAFMVHATPTSDRLQ